MEVFKVAKVKRAEERHAPEVSKQTGFPSPASHYLEQPIDLHEELSLNRDATFYIKVRGDAWTQHMICDKDVLIVDRSKEPSFDTLALVVQEGEFTVRRIPFDKRSAEFVVWGVITYIIHKAS